MVSNVLSSIIMLFEAVCLIGLVYVVISLIGSYISEYIENYVER